MSKRTHASVNEEPCVCDYLRRAADEPRVPITFDTETAEYQFSCRGTIVRILHCPLCGGAAPPSKRHLLFARISPNEEARLANLMCGIETIDEARQKLGTPYFEAESTARYFGKGGKEPPKIEHRREIRYHNLSEVAEIWIAESPNGRISWHLQGKYLGADN